MQRHRLQGRRDLRPSHQRLSTPREEILRWVAGAVASVWWVWLTAGLHTDRQSPSSTFLTRPAMEVEVVMIQPDPAQSIPEPEEQRAPLQPSEPPPEAAAPPSADQGVSEAANGNDAPLSAHSGPGDVAAGSAGRKAPATATDTIVRITAVDELDNLDFEPYRVSKPEYPREALLAGIEGFVDADLTVDDDGRVVGIEFAQISGHPLFGEATAQAVKAWRFPPPRIGGKKITIKHLYRVNFTLQ